jgi:hypothetical protein
MLNSFDDVQCEEVFTEEDALWAARSEADNVSEMELLDAAEFFDRTIGQIESCTVGDVCGWIPCECA